MTLPFTLPDWLPWWVPILLLVPTLLYGLLLLAMPFNVFGVKGRLEAIEARLDEIQGEIRSLALRLPEPLRGTAFDEPAFPPTPEAIPRARPTVAVRPPIPPAPYYTEPPQVPDADAPPVMRGVRAEPRLGRR